MVAKINSGMDFGGLVDYLEKEMKHARIIDSEGVCTVNREAIIDSFKTQYEKNGRIKKPVGHISLSWLKEDLSKVDDAKMAEVARDYLKRMGIENTQFIFVRHFDREHPHMHIMYNRVDNNGKTISDSHERTRSVGICKAITREYGFHFSQSDNVKRNRLRGKEKLRYQMKDIVKAAASRSASWEELQQLLNKDNIKVSFRYAQGKGIVGVVFVGSKCSFSGAKLDATLKFGALDAKFDHQLKSITYDTSSSGIEDNVTFKSHQPAALPAVEGAADTQPSGDNPPADADNGWTQIALQVALELLINGQSVHIGTGGGGSQSELPWRDKDDDKLHNGYKPRKGRR